MAAMTIPMTDVDELQLMHSTQYAIVQIHNTYEGRDVASNLLRGTNQGVWGRNSPAGSRSGTF